ncbi:hypothetical protein SAMN02745165_01744 [Malonomonas rubra DSM 5091]|uniref:Uncharacterized protein n=1 Tax=Malonomonas rubra DSM 5091 TaxID=1122189 RepID=A0A1M6H9F3_MALRU|nr:hypothetical protein [Malonomonas rubra]SHJ18838.1 hypothetical protein SAMN02745165_01744 [Malonomonas rubra DSM 5091]
MYTTLSFKGWIPTCSGGGLSFSNFGACQNPDSISSNVHDNNFRYVITYQKRELSDVVLPLKQILTKKIFGLDSTFWFLCLAKRPIKYEKSSARMQGTIYLFHRKSMWRGPAEKLVKKAQEKLEEYSSGCIKQYFDEDYNLLQEKIKSFSSFVIDFELRRSGVATLTYSATANHGTSVDAINLPNNPKERQSDIHYITSQMFFFLRDISHHHIHHESTDDNIVRLYPFDGNDDYSWRCETTIELLRKLLLYKKCNSEKIFNDSMGLIPYLKYFLKISKKETEKTIHPEIDMEILESAILAAQQTNKRKSLSSSAEKESILNWLVGGIGLILSTIGLSQVARIKPPEETSGFLLFMTSHMISHTIETIGVVAGLILSALIWFSVIEPREWSVIRGAVKIMFAFRQQSLSALIILMSLLGYVIFIAWLSKIFA